MLVNIVGGSAVATAAVTASVWGAGVAGAAPDVVGDTYNDAKTAIQQEGSTAIVATRVGGRSDEDDCIVTNAWDASFVRDSGPPEVMVALNCNADVASANTPGFSLGSPQGREAKAAQDEAAAAEEAPLEEVSTPGA